MSRVFAWFLDRLTCDAGATLDRLIAPRFNTALGRSAVVVVIPFQMVLPAFHGVQGRRTSSPMSNSIRLTCAAVTSLKMPCSNLTSALVILSTMPPMADQHRGAMHGWSVATALAMKRGGDRPSRPTCPRPSRPTRADRSAQSGRWPPAERLPRSGRCGGWSARPCCWSGRADRP